jgi:hypothetical protein
MPDPLTMARVLGVTAMLPAVAVLLSGLLSRAPASPRSAVVALLGVAAAFCLGYHMFGLRLRWPPDEDQFRLVLLLLPAALLVEVAAAISPLPRWLAWLPRLAVAAAAAPVLLHNTTYLADLDGPGSREWTPTQAALILGGLGAALAAVWAALALVQKRSPGRSVPLAVALTCAGAAVVVMLSGYLTVGQLILALAAALGGAALAPSALPRSSLAPGLLGLGIVGLFALLVCGRLFGKLTTPHAVLLGLAPLLVWLPELPYARALPALARGVVRVLVVLVPLALVAAQAQQKFIEDSRPAAGAGEKEPSIEDYMNFGK